MNGVELNVNHSILFLYTCGLAYYSPSFFHIFYLRGREPLIGGGGGIGEDCN